ncbi:hypothetical protein, partial [Ralstonia solanacearum]|uniref:hypothetical protein n=1 Tax=Ralstonia solanacearum TaxID=305 RepID=UPI001E4BC404
AGAYVLGLGPRVFPAPAGMNRNFGVFSMTRTSVPRACGDEPTLPVDGAADVECSPRLRG